MVELAKYMDLDEGLARVRGNLSLYCKLLKLFVLSEEFDNFENALKNQELSKACDIVHGIKGLAGNLSLKLLFDCSAVLNNQLKCGSIDATDLAAYRDTLDATKSAIAHFLAKSGA